MAIFISELGVHLQVFLSREELKVNLWGLLAKRYYAKNIRDFKNKNTKVSLRIHYNAYMTCHSYKKPECSSWWYYLPPIRTGASLLLLHEHPRSFHQLGQWDTQWSNGSPKSSRTQPLHPSWLQIWNNCYLLLLHYIIIYKQSHLQHFREDSRRRTVPTW